MYRLQCFVHIVSYLTIRMTHLTDPNAQEVTLHHWHALLVRWRWPKTDGSKNAFFSLSGHFVVTFIFQRFAFLSKYEITMSVNLYEDEREKLVIRQRKLTTNALFYCYFFLHNRRRYSDVMFSRKSLSMCVSHTRLCKMLGLFRKHAMLIQIGVW